MSISQSAETLYVEGAGYPCTVEVNSKGHAMEAVEVSAAVLVTISVGFNLAVVAMHVD